MFKRYFTREQEKGRYQMTYAEKLKSEKKQIKVVIDYLVKQVIGGDESLVYAIEHKDNNNVLGMWNYIKDKAKKQAEDGCAMVEDSKVYEWAREYWLDYEEKEKKAVDPEDTEKVEHYNPSAKAWERHAKEREKQTQKEAINKLYEVNDLFGGEF